MQWLDQFRLRLRSLTSRSRVEDELTDELRFHLDQQIAENIAAGMPPDEARNAALRTIGNLESLKEECRDERHVEWIGGILRDVRHAIRMLKKDPAFTSVAVLSLALGIGVNTAIFSVVDAVLLKSLPVANPEQLVALEVLNPRGESSNFSYPMYQEVRQRVPAFSGVLAALDGNNHVELTMPDGHQLTDVQLQLVSGEYFDVLGVRPALGRSVTPQDTAVAVLSDRFWKRSFRGDPSILGQSIVVQRQPLTIIGIARPEFFGESAGRAPDLWVPLVMQPDLSKSTSLLDSPNTGWLRLMARLKPGVDEGGARAALAVFHGQLQAEPGRIGRWVRGASKFNVLSGAKGLDNLRRTYSQPLAVLIAIVGLILVLACASVANLLLARGTQRHREISIRLAIGAARSRIVRQLMTENALIVLLGAGLGVLFANWGVKALLVLVSGGPEPMRLNAALDLRVLAFTAGVSVLSSFLFGLAPAFRASRTRAGLTVTSTARPSQLPGRVLVVLQIAVSVLLVTGAGLFVRTLQNLRTQDLGFRPQGLLQVRIGPWPAGYKAEQLAALQERLLASVRSIPGVLSASMTTNGFSSGISRTCCIAIEGYTFHTGEDRQVRNLGVTPNYFETVQLPILLGRPFSGQDSHVAIINSSMARRYYGAASPIGQRFGWGDPPKVKYDTEIIGVVEDASIGNLREEARPLIYMPAAGGNSIQVRTWLQASVMAPSIREAIRRVDQNLTNDTRSIAEIVDRALVTEKLMARLGSFFGVLAIVLAGVGLYGLTNYSVVCRTREIGIRMALGATQMEVIGMVGRQVATLVICGLAVGVPASLASERLLRGLLFGVSSHDPEVLLVLPIQIAVAVLAAVRPSRRAAAVDPVNALRDE